MRGLNSRLKLASYAAILLLVGALAGVTGCGDDGESDSGGFDVDDLALSGQILDLDSEGLELENDAGEVLQIDAGDDSFSFSTVYSKGEDYEVTVAQQPQSQECSVTRATGTFDERDITDVLVECETTAEFQVAINTDASDLVTGAGGNIRLVAEITNEGQLDGEQEVTLNIEDREIATESISIDGGRTKVVTLTWETTLDDVGDHMATVSTGDDADEAQVTVTDLDYFEVRIDTEESMLSVTEHDDVVVVVDVENVGAQPGTQDIELAIDDHTVDTVHSLGLDDGEAITISLQWTPQADDRGEFNVEVKSDNDTDTATATVVDGAYFDVEIDFSNSLLQIAPDDTAEVLAHITNIGGVEATQDIELTVDGDVVDTHQDLALDPEDSHTVTLQWDGDGAPSGSVAAQVASDDTSSSFVVTVLEPAFYGVDIDLFASDLEVIQGDIAYGAAKITNFGQVTGEQDVQLSIDGDVVDTVHDFQVAPGSVETVMLEWDTTDAGGTYDAIIATDDDDDSFSIFVEDNCSALAEIGDECVGGSYYAGDFNDVAYYTTETSAGGGAGFKYAQGSSDSGAESQTDGWGNTVTLINQTDSGAPYEAAEACADLDAHGHQDWFLPAIHELEATIGEHRDILPNVEAVSHWSSTGNNPPNDHVAYGQNMDTGSSFGTSKTSENAVRCVRTD